MHSCFVEVDLAQAEWVVTGHLARDAQMLDVIRNDLDPHTRTGALISRAPEAFVLLENDIVGHSTDPVEISNLRRKLPTEFNGVPIAKYFMPRNMSIRQAGKKSNHGLNYNMQYKRFALENGMPENDANTIVNTYRNIAYPGLKTYYDFVANSLRKNNRRLTNCYGQSRQFLDKWGNDLLDAAYAFLPQSTVGNITAFAWQAIYNDTDLQKCVDLGAQVHDSILTEHRFTSFSQLADQINSIVAYLATPFEYFAQRFVIKREVKIGLSWGESAMTLVPIIGRECAVVNARDVEKSWELANAAQVQ